MIKYLVGGAASVAAIAFVLSAMIGTMQDNRTQIESLINRVATLEVQVRIHTEEDE